MRKIVLICLLLVTFTGFGQDRHFYKNTVFHVQGNLFEAQHYNSPKYHPLRQFTGVAVGASTDLLSSPSFRFDVRLGYRYINDYANPQAIIYSSGNTNEYFDYHGAYSGFGFYLGNRHSWETALIFGLGTMSQPSQSFRSITGELGAQTGYMFVSQKGFVIRAGMAIDLARNGFFSNMYSGYFGLGYAIQKDQGIIEPKSEPREKDRPYFNATLSGYIGNVSGDFVGVNLRLDHLIHNGTYVDLGYGISGRAGISYFGSSMSTSASFITLIGQGNNKFEFTLGPNLYFEDGSFTYYDWYDFLHLGFGYRYVSESSPLTMRLGIATTGILHFGVGLKLPY